MSQDLINDLLCHIPDNTTIGEMSLTYGPTLVTNINLALTDESVTSDRLSLTSTGSDIREALRKLDPKTQVSILYNIVVHKRDDNKPKEDDTKLFKVKFAKLVSVSFFIIGVIFLISILKAYLTDGKLPDVAVLTAAFAVIVGMVKIIISGD